MNLFKSEKQIIDEIHCAFDSAQDRLLSEAENLLSTLEIPTETQIESQAARLKNIGFSNVPTVEKAEKLVKKRAEVAHMAVATKEQADLIKHYKQSYPFIKFITEGELKRICDKYSLVHAPIENYIKEVPNKNILDIERAQKLKTSDARPVSYKLVANKNNKEKFDMFLKSINKEGGVFEDGEDVKLLNEHYLKCDHNHFGIDSTTWTFVIWQKTGGHGCYTFDHVETIDKSGLFIAAPLSHFNLDKLSKKSKHGFFNVIKREVKDPIVFRYVRGGVQILTMWGLEANDPALVNPINN